MTDVAQTFHCATCGAERDIDDLPRVTLIVCDGRTSQPFSVLMCKLCTRTLLVVLHKDYCPGDCAEVHEFSDA